LARTARALGGGFAVASQPSLRSKASSAHLKQLVKKIGQDKAMEMLKGAPLFWYNTRVERRIACQD
jgi:hypothetical protein